MNEININISEFQGKKVLITPLNWGLGHATRCIPIIHLFQNNNIDILIASDGEALLLLNEEFPELETLELPSYHIRYPFKSMELNMVYQAPRFMKAMVLEHRKIKHFVSEKEIDVIISDNRFGCFSKECRSIFMTHQVKLIGSNTFSQWLANFINLSIINRFNEVWIPDFKGELSLSGILSKNDKLSSIRYINPLSRFEKLDTELSRDILIILSGPEPARTQLETQLVKILELTGYNILLVRGTKNKNKLNINFSVKDFMSADDLNQEIQCSKLVICRSGYTSIMDLYLLDKNAILIPTPGQPEQEYLANYHSGKSIFEIWNVDEEKQLLIDLIESKLKKL